MIRVGIQSFCETVKGKMEEITLRFEIIRLAVELGDFDTIDLQCRKLQSLSLDERLDEIIELLESRNYRQALYGMKYYHQSLEDEFFNEQHEREVRAGISQSEELGEKSQRFGEDIELEEEDSQEDEYVMNLDDILRFAEEDISERASETSSEEAHPEKIEKEVRETKKASSPTEEYYDKASSTPSPKAESTEKVRQESTKVNEREETPESEPFEESMERTKHPPISYIGQKYRNMMHQFPPVESAETLVPEVEKMREKIATEGYTEEEIEHFLQAYQDYKKEGHRAEAAQVLLLAAATESKFAQFLLARELFRGEVIQKDHAESFTQINTLADQNFAEAICDLGQFYEYGIGIGKDREMALLLYEEAAELGVARARKHYERLKNSRGIKGLLGKVKVPLKLPKKTKE